MAPLLGVVDLFVVTSGRSDRQVRTIAEEVERVAKLRCGRGPIRIEGLSDARWVLWTSATSSCTSSTRDPRLLRPRAPLVRRDAPRVDDPRAGAAERT